MRPWLMLALSASAQVAGALFLTTPVLLLPVLQRTEGVGLAEGGALSAAPTLGSLLTLFLWGLLSDRIGERRVIVLGLALTTTATVLAVFSTGVIALGVAFFLGGMFAASTAAASGRIVVGWFPRERRGLAMGIRHMSAPVGITIGAVAVPVLSETVGIQAAIVVPLVLLAVVLAACALWLRNPPAGRWASGSAAEAAPLNPYRVSAFLVRIHVVSMLSMVPQIALATFGLVWLISDQGWDAAAAGGLVGAAQLAGAAGRVGFGSLSDRLGSRVRPLRWVLAGIVVSMAALAVLDALHVWGAALVFAVAVGFTQSPNGLAFTSVAEYAGPRWSGRALGIQNTGQFVVATVGAPALGALITLVGYPIVFAATSVFAAVALPLTPTRADEARPPGTERLLNDL